MLSKRPHESFALVDVGGSEKIEQVVLLHFCAEWAQLCEVLHPRLEKLAEAFPSLVIATVNTTESTTVLQEFSIESIPTLILLEHGGLVAVFTGDVEYVTLESRISTYL
ncbi:hypothetical protein CV102_19880 [Natronococcus pandeyae]|uniref:Thioredoxin domain-containing protein n=1 Tax=Natronococcus pandeyae TaxID=2055836 RepID=A0A8J8TNT0_9EURY|nr:thioredoxin family protein [Natronococcus pandeyae]TYL37011.1 hypothetical protein CV102_19880 [Natronococcus pandeyae]